MEQEQDRAAEGAEQQEAAEAAREQEEARDSGNAGQPGGEEKAADTEVVTDGEPAAADGEPVEEIDLAEQVAMLKATLVDTRLRYQAELENFQKRLEREHGEHLKYAAEKVMKDLVPTLDNLELAITYGTKEEVCRNMLMGIQMTQKLLLEAVGRHGLLPVGKEGEPFDPARHEAVGFESRADLGADVVARVLQSGYALQGRLVRPAKVMVNKP